MLGGFCMRFPAGTTMVPCARSRPQALPVLCSSSGASTNSSSSSSAQAAGRRKIKAGNNTGSISSLPSVSTAATVAAATVTAVAVEEEKQVSAAAAASDITLVNPPLGFSNNIVPARPLAVTQPLPAGADSSNLLSSTVDSSDEDLDDTRPATPAGGGTGRSSAWRCLVLDSRYLPVNVVNWGRAVVMDLSGKVDVLEYHPDGFAFSAYKQHPLPAVLRVRTFVDVHEFAGRLALTRKNIMLRDHYRCQYCGSAKELTLDHITPVCRGGVNSWQNLVTACMVCNQRKGDKSLQQLGWQLPCVPREPTPQEVGVVAGISKSDLERPPAPWVPYLATYKAALEKAQKRAAATASSSSSNKGLIDSAAVEQLVSSSSSSSSKGSSSGARAAGAVAVAAKVGGKKKASAAKRMRT